MNVVGFVVNEEVIAQPSSACPLPVICPLIPRLSLSLKNDGSGT